MQTKTMRHHFTLSLAIIKKKKKVGKNLEKLGSLFTAGGIVKCCNYCGKVWQFLKRLNTDLPYDPRIPLLGTYPKAMSTQIFVHKCS